MFIRTDSMVFDTAGIILTVEENYTGATIKVLNQEGRAMCRLANFYSKEEAQKPWIQFSPI